MKKNIKIQEINKKNSKFYKKLKDRGITLIALVITIIILLILAGVTLNMALSQNGLFSRAQNASDKYMQESEKEQKLFAITEATMNNVNYLYTDKNGDTLTIPVGFAPTGIEGENTVKDGFVIIDVNGNEFVWIPCTIDGNMNSVKYDRYAFTTDDWYFNQNKNETGTITENNTNWVWEENISEDEQSSVDKYKGFYIGRYETGIESTDQRTNEDINNLLDVPVVQSNRYPYSFVNPNNAVQIAEKMYSDSKFIKSKLCSSFAWDTTLMVMCKVNKDYVTNSIGGVYKTNDLPKPEYSEKTGNDLIHPFNIYDMGGNMSEITSEIVTASNSDHNDNGSRASRGGRIVDDPAKFSAASRWSTSSHDQECGTVGFRVTLFII